MLKNISNLLKNMHFLKNATNSGASSLIINKTNTNGEEDTENTTQNKRSLLGRSVFVMASLALIADRYKEARCFFLSRSKKGDLESSIETIQYPANDPIEDRFAYGELTSVGGSAAAVFDGHGGWQVCKLIS